MIFAKLKLGENDIKIWMNMDEFKNKNDPTQHYDRTIYVKKDLTKYKSTQATHVYGKLMVKIEWFKEESKVEPWTQAHMDMKNGRQ